MTGDSLSRRGALTSAGLALSVPLATPSLANMRPEDALARVIGTLAPGGRRQMAFDGRLAMVSITGHAMPAFAVRGVVETRITASGERLECRRSWSGSLTDVNGEPLPDRFQNPVTGQWLATPRIAAETAFDLADPSLGLKSRNAGPLVTFDLEEPGPAVLAPRLSLSYTALSAHLLGPPRASIAAHGTWRVTAPWPAWLAMGDAPGHVVMEGRVGTSPSLAES